RRVLVAAISGCVGPVRTVCHGGLLGGRARRKAVARALRHGANAGWREAVTPFVRYRKARQSNPNRTDFSDASSTACTTRWNDRSAALARWGVRAGCSTNSRSARPGVSYRWPNLALASSVSPGLWVSSSLIHRLPPAAFGRLNG